MPSESSTIQRDRILAAAAGVDLPQAPAGESSSSELRDRAASRRPARKGAGTRAHRAPAAPTDDACAAVGDDGEYEPGISEFALPVQVLRFACRAERALVFPPHEGASPGTTLAGAFGTAVMDALCLSAQIGEPWCPVERSVDGGCRVPGGCAVARLRKPRSPTLETQFPTPVFLRASRLEHGGPVEAFELHVVLWGRRATSLRPYVETALGRMAANGFSVAGAKIPFALGAVQASPVRPLAECAGPPYRGRADRVTLLLETPLVGFADQWDDLRRGRACVTELAHRLVRGALAGVARDLVLWDTEEREETRAFSREARLEMSRTAAQRAIDAVASVQVEDAALEAVDMGRRRSRTNGRVFPVRGFTGRIDLRGPLGLPWPWLAAASLARWGGKRGLGFGEVTVRVAPRLEPGPPRRSAAMQRRLRRSESL